jgi:hypothetical protein
MLQKLLHNLSKKQKKTKNQKKVLKIYKLLANALKNKPAEQKLNMLVK